MAVVSCPECGCDVDAENLDKLLQCAECHYQFFHVPSKKQSSEIALMKTTLSEEKKHNERRVFLLSMVFFIGFFGFIPLVHLIYDFPDWTQQVLYWGIVVFVLSGIYYQVHKGLAAARDASKKAEEAKRQEKHRQRGIHKKFKTEFENRKQTIGQIVCPQCQWTGTWGEGMSYQEFFAYEIRVKHKCWIDEKLVGEADNLDRESQYKCPMCKSTNWQKA